jgi:hypothetical protein
MRMSFAQSSMVGAGQTGAAGVRPSMRASQLVTSESFAAYNSLNVSLSARHFHGVTSR